MSEVFLKVVNMSISASWLVLAVLLLRLALKKAPKWVSVLLWGFVAVRLICPFSIESMLSLIPSAETIRPTVLIEAPEIHTGIPFINNAINPMIQESVTTIAPEKGINTLKLMILFFSKVWVVGAVLLFAYTAVSYLLLRRKVATAVLLRNNIYQSENVDSPFVLGILKPKIYLPFSMDSENLKHVLAHEESHIRRKDHWWKPFGFAVLALHWFNPLMWLGYLLLCRDIELACDEKVIKELNAEQKADYSWALLTCSVNRRSIAACPLAFGEVGVKERVKSVMNYKKPAFWIIAASVVACAAVAVCFLTNPKAQASSVGGADGLTSIDGEVKLTEKISDMRESSYKISVGLPATDLSAPGQILADKIVQEWSAFDGMTQLQQMTSSHLWGTIYLNTDTWSRCEQAIGVPIANPLESVDWINKTGYFGMEGADPSTPVTHVQAIADATENAHRKLSKITVTAGYNKGSVRITLSATISANTVTFNTGSVCPGYATYEQSKTRTGSGAPVLIVTTNAANNTGYFRGDYFDPTAYWVKDNVFYELRVFGDAADQTEIQNILEQLLAEI